jgi:hypothetical protein
MSILNLKKCVDQSACEKVIVGGLKQETIFIKLATLSGSSIQQNLHVIQTSNRFAPLANLQNLVYRMHQENCTQSSITHKLITKQVPDAAKKKNHINR